MIEKFSKNLSKIAHQKHHSISRTILFLYHQNRLNQLIFISNTLRTKSSLETLEIIDNQAIIFASSKQSICNTTTVIFLSHCTDETMVNF